MTPLQDPSSLDAGVLADGSDLERLRSLRKSARSSKGGFAFTGREWDPETNLYYYRARYYDPKIGRFLSEDPEGFIDGP